MAIKLYESSNIQAIADAIRSKGQTGTMKVSEMAGRISSIPTGGGGGTPDHGVFFIDYDGTVVEAWESAEVASKTALPNNPTREGYTSQGWNWALADIKSYIASYPNVKLTVGQMYAWITPDDYTQNTKFYITLTKATGLSITCSMTGNKTWGDGTSDSATSHTYSDYGEYVIECDGTSIPEYVFGQSSSDKNYTCTKVEIGKNVTSIGGNSFQHCRSLTNINIPSGVMSIGSNAFEYCTALTNIDIPNSVTMIGVYAFQYCYSLTNINIAKGVTSIGNYAFAYCYSLTNISIPNSVASIGNYAFRSCSSLNNISIPNSVMGIGTYAFASCSSLNNINIPNSVTSIGIFMFSQCGSLSNINIPNSVMSIGNNAFESCYVLNNINIPNSVTSIGNYAFQNCSTLNNINIPNSVTSIGTYAFWNCYAFTHITIPSGVTSIGSSTFMGCHSLIRYDFTQHASVPTLSDTSAFTNINGICKIIVPDALYDSWITAAKWSTYANYIYKASEVS